MLAVDWKTKETGRAQSKPWGLNSPYQSNPAPWTHSSHTKAFYFIHWKLDPEMDCPAHLCLLPKQKGTWLIPSVHGRCLLQPSETAQGIFIFPGKVCWLLQGHANFQRDDKSKQSQCPVATVEAGCPALSRPLVGTQEEGRREAKRQEGGLWLSKQKV